MSDKCHECGRDMDGIHAPYCINGKAKSAYEGWCRYNG